MSHGLSVQTGGTTNEVLPPILYVDDEPMNLRVFEAAFEDYYEVHTAESARQAIEILRRHEVQLIIADQRMPGMTGVQLLEAVISEFPNAMRMILTGYVDVDSIVRAINAGRIHQYITKPWEEKHLKIIIDRALESYHLKQRHRQLLDELELRVEREKQLRLAFQQYVPAAIVDELLDLRNEGRFLGETRIVAVLFSVIHDFGELCSRLPPERLFPLLHRYQGTMNSIIASHQGTIRDDHVAVFGAPISSLNNAENALRAAASMIDRVAAFNEQEADELESLTLSVGIGLNLGEVVAGNIGSEDKMEYSVIGDTVNTAARIAELTQAWPNSTLLSHSVYEQVSDLARVDELSTTQLRGRPGEVRLYRLLENIEDA